MTVQPKQIGFDEWDARYRELREAGMREPAYGGPLRRHAEDGDRRLPKLRYDNSAAALRLWNFLLSEEDRLLARKNEGHLLVGAMKDLGTVPVLAYSLPEVTAFYPDGAWWIPCVMELSAGLLDVADELGLDESFCPVRAMAGAFLTEAHFPIPDLLTCSVGATCDDFSAIAQRLNGLGYPVLWWEMPHRHAPDPGEDAVVLPGGFEAPAWQVELVRAELERVRGAIEHAAGRRLDEETLREGIRRANAVRRCLRKLRERSYGACRCPMPALEMLVAEMLAIHFCSDRDESLAVLECLLEEVEHRIAADTGVLPEDAARVYWVNPVADLRAMNLLEACGGRICGTEYLFCHALEPVPEDVQPMEALARAALADPMVGTSSDRARRVAEEARAFGAEAVVVSRIPGASHCATEGAVICDIVRAEMDIPVVEFEVPPLCDSVEPGLGTRLTALVETVVNRRNS